MKSKSTIRLRRSTFSIRRFLSGNCVDDRKDPPPLICLTIWPCAQPASLLSVSEVVPILTQSILGLQLASVTTIVASDWSAASTLLTGHSFPQHLPAVASYCQSVLPQPPAQPGPLPILVSVCCDCPNTATALESAAISSVYLQSEIIKIQDLWWCIQEDDAANLEDCWIHSKYPSLAECHRAWCKGMMRCLTQLGVNIDPAVIGDWHRAMRL